jgi:hypothetical protein
MVSINAVLSNSYNVYTWYHQSHSFPETQMDTLQRTGEGDLLGHWGTILKVTASVC